MGSGWVPARYRRRAARLGRCGSFGRGRAAARRRARGSQPPAGAGGAPRCGSARPFRGTASGTPGETGSPHSLPALSASELAVWVLRSVFACGVVIPGIKKCVAVVVRGARHSLSWPRPGVTLLHVVLACGDLEGVELRPGFLQRSGAASWFYLLSVWGSHLCLMHPGLGVEDSAGPVKLTDTSVFPGLEFGFALEVTEQLLPHVTYTQV